MPTFTTTVTASSEVETTTSTVTKATHISAEDASKYICPKCNTVKIAPPAAVKAPQPRASVSLNDMKLVEAVAAERKASAGGSSWNERKASVRPSVPGFLPPNKSSVCQEFPIHEESNGQDFTMYLNNIQEEGNDNALEDPLEVLGAALAMRGVRVDQVVRMCASDDGTLGFEDWAGLITRYHVNVSAEVVEAVWEEVLKATDGAEATVEIVTTVLKRSNALGDPDQFDLEKFHRVSHVKKQRATMRASRAKMVHFFPRMSVMHEQLVADKTKQKYIALVAHNDMKPTMMAFVATHVEFFRECNVVTTNSTGKSLEGKLGIEVGHKVSSGPLGGDQEIGALISKGEVGGVFFFRDPLSSHPHESDIQALTRLCDVHDVLSCTNPRTGDALVHALQTSPTHIENMSRDHAHDTSSVVAAYKAKQAAAIASVIASPGKATL